MTVNVLHQVSHMIMIKNVTLGEKPREVSQSFLLLRMDNSFQNLDNQFIYKLAVSQLLETAVHTQE